MVRQVHDSRLPCLLVKLEVVELRLNKVDDDDDDREH